MALRPLNMRVSPEDRRELELIAYITGRTTGSLVEIALIDGLGNLFDSSTSRALVDVAGGPAGDRFTAAIDDDVFDLLADAQEVVNMVTGRRLEVTSLARCLLRVWLEDSLEIRAQRLGIVRPLKLSTTKSSRGGAAELASFTPKRRRSAKPAAEALPLDDDNDSKLREAS